MLLKRGKMRAKGQAGIEYLIVIAFVVFILTTMLGIALYYSSSVQDRIKITQITDCANKILSASESVFYSGYPSRSTVSCYMPESTNELSVIDNSLIISFQASSGLQKSGYSSKVPISSSSPLTFSGHRKILVATNQSTVLLSLQ